MYRKQAILLSILASATICPAQLVKYEAENASLSGTATKVSDATASGASYVSFGSSGRIDFSVSVAKAETYLLRVSNKGANATSRSFENIEVNGTKIIDQQYAAGYNWDPTQTGHYTGAGELEKFKAFKASITKYGDANDPWQTTDQWWSHTGGMRNTPMAIQLKAGSNTISIVKDWGGTKWDKIEIDTAYPNRALSVSFTINTKQDVAPISPYIYGSSLRFNIADDALTMMRFGGNLTTPYNWENNYTNAGHDWHHSSSRIGWPEGIMPKGRETEPGVALTYHHDRNLERGFESLMPISMIGYVAADGKGEVSEAETAPSIRWKQTKYKKGAPFCNPPGKPDTSDPYVYSDELVNFLVSKYGNASTPKGIKWYVLDNEPRLWSWNHVRIHPDTLTGGELVSKSKELAAAIKDVDPYVKIFGPAFYGIWPMYDLQNKSDWNKIKKDYSWFVDYYLDEMKKGSDVYGKRLMDVFTFHHYFGTSSQEARMQEPRSLWDKDFKADPLLVRVQKSIDKYFPGTKIAITEWSYGGDSLISGGIATADLLGIFGKMGLFQASYWTLDLDRIYQIAAFRLFRNYDGKKSTYGDTKVLAETSDKTNTSFYASTTTSKAGQVNMIVLNKNLSKQITGKFKIASSDNFKTGKAWAFDEKSPKITERAAITNIVNNEFTYTIPPSSAMHFVLQAETNPVSTLHLDKNSKAIDPLSIHVAGNQIHMQCDLIQKGNIDLKVFDLQGNLVHSVASSELAIGRYDFSIDQKNLTRGMYQVRLKTEFGSYSKHLVIK